MLEKKTQKKCVCVCGGGIDVILCVQVKTRVVREGDITASLKRRSSKPCVPLEEYVLLYGDIHLLSQKQNMRAIGCSFWTWYYSNCTRTVISIFMSTDTKVPMYDTSHDREMMCHPNTRCEYSYAHRSRIENKQR